MTTRTLERITTVGGNTAVFEVRDDTSDSALVHGIIGGREYDLPTGLSGWAIDIGAHIGIVTVALALDNSDLRIVAVEALADNCRQLQRNIELNGVSDRVTILHDAAGSEEEWRDGRTVPIAYGWSNAINQPDAYMADNRYIGGMVGPNDSSQVETCNVIGLASCLKRPWGDIEEVALLKIDCEGCEWFFLTSPELVKVQRIIGEMHIGKHGDAKRLRKLLVDFDVTMDDSLVVATFEAVRRPMLTTFWTADGRKAFKIR